MQNSYNKEKLLELNTYNGNHREINNMVISTMIANFHRKFGLKNKGVTIGQNIITSIKDDTPCIKERSLLIWNICFLIDEYIDSKQYKKAMNLIIRGEENFSRDGILGDDTGYYHISWRDEILIRKAKIYFEEGRIQRGIAISSEVIENRKKIITIAKNQSEIINKDKCLYSCYKNMSKYVKNRDDVLALRYIKNAVRCKCDNLSLFEEIDVKGEVIESTRGKQIAYKYYLNEYLKQQDISFDNIKYMYCETCKNNISGKCKKYNILITDKKACESYISKD